MQILIGSRAVKNIFSDYRECNDWDYLVNEIPTNKEENTEYYIIPPLSEYLLHHELDKNVLYTLKVSHSFWNINFEKTIYDIRFLKQKESKIIETLYKDLYDFWETVHGKKNVYLNEINEKFFTAKVERIIEHDKLHEILAYYDEPMFKKLKKDLNKAWISKDMFNNLSYNDKLKTCREELYVIATERFLIPSNFKINSLIAYKKAFRLLVTSLSKGWFPLFIIENIEALDKPDIKYSDIVNKYLTTREKKMKFQEFEELIQTTFNISLDDVMITITHENNIDNDEGDDIEESFKEKIATYEVIESYDRDLFDTETEFWVVKFITLDGTEFFVRIDGYYNSWDSTDYDGAEAYEVIKKKRVVEEWVTPETQSNEDVIYLD